jgi:hypothetical protein
VVEHISRRERRASNTMTTRKRRCGWVGEGEEGHLDGACEGERHGDTVAQSRSVFPWVDRHDFASHSHAATVELSRITRKLFREHDLVNTTSVVSECAVMPLGRKKHTTGQGWPRCASRALRSLTVACFAQATLRRCTTLRFACLMCMLKHARNTRSCGCDTGLPLLALSMCPCRVMRRFYLMGGQLPSRWCSTASAAQSEQKGCNFEILPNDLHFVEHRSP